MADSPLIHIPVAENDCWPEDSLIGMAGGHPSRSYLIGMKSAGHSVCAQAWGMCLCYTTDTRPVGITAPKIPLHVTGVANHAGR